MSGTNKCGKYEMRGVWVCTVGNSNMPKGLTKDGFEEWAQKLLTDIKELNYNTIVFQVKPEADALYKSRLAPWSAFCTGVQGVDPGYDPLELIIGIAHNLGLELHAWINPYRVTIASQTFEDLCGENFAVKNPQYRVKYGAQYFLNPGYPEVRKYLVDSVAEIVENYDIDAVHIDDYFYPYKVAGEVYPDGETFSEYGKDFSDIEDWRRNNVTVLISEINAAIKEKKHWVQFGISPFSVWRNKSDDPTGSETTAGTNNYDGLYADTRAWIQEGSIDYIVPQLYFSRRFEAVNYSVMLDWWSNEVEEYAKVHPILLYIGMGDYRVTETKSERDPGWDADEISGQIGDNRNSKNAAGQVHFTALSILGNRHGYHDIVAKERYSHLSLTPPAGWLCDKVPEMKCPVTVTKNENGSTIEINAENACGCIRKFAVYRFEEGEPLCFGNPANLAGIVYRKDLSVFHDKNALPNKNYTYAVKAYSETGIESNGFV